MHYSDMYDPSYLEIHDNLSHTTQTISLSENPFPYQKHPTVPVPPTSKSTISFTIQSGVVTSANPSSSHPPPNVASRGRSSSISAGNSYPSSYAYTATQIASSPVIKMNRNLNKRQFPFEYGKMSQPQVPSDPRATSQVSRVVKLTPQITLRTRVPVNETSPIDKRLKVSEFRNAPSSVSNQDFDAPLERPIQATTTGPLSKKTNNLSLPALKSKYPHLQPKGSVDKENAMPANAKDPTWVNPPEKEKPLMQEKPPIDANQLRTNNEWLLRKKEAYGPEYGKFLESLVLEGTLKIILVLLVLFCRSLGNYR